MVKEPKRRKRSSSRIAVIIIVTAICVIAAAFVGAAFAGVQPLATYKDNILKSDITSTSTSSQPPSITQTSEVTVESIYACPTCGYVLVVGLTPTPQTKADYPYEVDLFEKGKLRQTGTVTWRQGEIDNNRAKGVDFDLTAEEWESYLGRNVDNIFSVSVH